MIDLSNVPIKALQRDTVNLLCLKLNAKKLLPSSNGHLRDWRGFAQLTGLEGDEIAALDWLQNPCSKVLEMWINIRNPKKAANLANFLEILGELDRWDIADDSQALIERDAQVYQSNQETAARSQLPVSEALTEDDFLRQEHGLTPQMYDALLLYASEDCDRAKLVCDVLEKKGLKICVKERDLLVGVFEHSAMLKLIADRCNRVVAIFSNAFLKTSLNRFLVSYAQSVGIYTDIRKVIPVTFEECEIPSELNFNFRLKYTPYNTLYNFEDKLFRSVCPTHMLEPIVNQGALPKTTVNQQVTEKNKNINKTIMCETLPDVPDHELVVESGYQSDSSKDTAEPKKKSKIKNFIRRLGKKKKRAEAS